MGNRKKLNDSSIEERFAYTSIIAKTRSIISLGLSIFEETSANHYTSTTYNIVVLCSEDYIVEPGSLNFLVHHGFDFKKQYTSGVPYHRGDDKAEDTNDDQLLRFVFEELVKSGKPLVFHNGLIDLIFLYQNLYARLPTSLQSFIADLTEMFPGGIYDTKYLAEYVCRTQASYLQYVFTKKYDDNIFCYIKKKKIHFFFL